MTTLHKNPIHFVQVVENSLHFIYEKDMIRWNKVYDFYGLWILSLAIPVIEYTILTQVA